MSYDLRLTSAAGDRSPPWDSVCDFLLEDGRYAQSADLSVLYENPLTGVHFVVNADPLEVTLNFCRPSTFAWEAAQEIELLTNEFALLAAGPNTTKPHAFDPEAFEHEWATSNRWAIGRMASENRDRLFSVSENKLRAFWLWNRERDCILEEMGRWYRVPNIFFLESRGRIETCFAWPHEQPTLLPEVDLVFVLEAGSEERGWKLPFRKVRAHFELPDARATAWSEIEDACDLHEAGGGPRHWALVSTLVEGQHEPLVADEPGGQPLSVVDPARVFTEADLVESPQND